MSRKKSVRTESPPARSKRLDELEAAMRSLRRQLVAVKRNLAALEHKQLCGALTRPEIVQARALAGQKRRIERQLEHGYPGNTIKPRREWQQRKGVRNHQVPGGLPTLGR